MKSFVNKQKEPMTPFQEFLALLEKARRLYAEKERSQDIQNQLKVSEILTPEELQHALSLGLDQTTIAAIETYYQSKAGAEDQIQGGEAIPPFAIEDAERQAAYMRPVVNSNDASKQALYLDYYYPKYANLSFAEVMNRSYSLKRDTVFTDPSGKILLRGAIRDQMATMIRDSLLKKKPEFVPNERLREKLATFDSLADVEKKAPGLNEYPIAEVNALIAGIAYIGSPEDQSTLALDLLLQKQSELTPIKAIHAILADALDDLRKNRCSFKQQAMLLEKTIQRMEENPEYQALPQAAQEALFDPLQAAYAKLPKTEEEFKALYILSKMRIRLMEYNATQVKAEAAAQASSSSSRLGDIKRAIQHVVSSAKRKVLSAVEQEISDIDVLTNRILQGQDMSLKPLVEVEALAMRHLGSPHLDKEDYGIPKLYREAEQAYEAHHQEAPPHRKEKL